MEGRVLRRGSKKGLSRRRLEGRNTPFREYDPIGMRPKYRLSKNYGHSKMQRIPNTLRLRELFSKSSRELLPSSL